MGNIYINDLFDKYPGKSVLEINDILLNDGIDNKKIKIKVKCKACDKEFIVAPGIYKKQKNFYCDEHMRHKPQGTASPFYNRTICQCSQCGKDIYLTNYQLNKKNKFGDVNNFCSQECYWNFRRVYYVGEKGAMYGHIYTDEQKEHMSRGAAKRYSGHDLTDTNIQLLVNDMLTEMNISYIREHTLDYYSCDNFLNDYNLIIEVMGDYWHGNPLKYNENRRKLNEIQSRTILKDKQKRGYIKNHYGYYILNLWETDIEKYPDKCKKLITKFIASQGILDNYNSFNYVINDDTLSVVESPISSYQEMKSEEYNHIIKQII